MFFSILKLRPFAVFAVTTESFSKSNGINTTRISTATLPKSGCATGA
jgi:hypothetical protein